MRRFNYFSHFGYVVLTVAFLLTPFLASRNLLSYSGEKDLPNGKVLSAESSAFNRYLRFRGSRPLTGSRQTVAAYAFPGQTTSYNDIYRINNQQTGQLRARIREVQVRLDPSLSVRAVVFFGENPETTEVLLGSGGAASVNLQLLAPNTLPQPLSVEVSFSLETE